MIIQPVVCIYKLASLSEIHRAERLDFGPKGGKCTAPISFTCIMASLSVFRTLARGLQVKTFASPGLTSTFARCLSTGNCFKRVKSCREFDCQRVLFWAEVKLANHHHDSVTSQWVSHSHTHYSVILILILIVIQSTIESLNDSMIHWMTVHCQWLGETEWLTQLLTVSVIGSVRLT